MEAKDGLLVDPWAPVEPALLVSPSWSFTRGPEVADFSALLGFEPMPEQEDFLDAVFALNSDGLPACTDLTDVAGRQNLKTGEFVMTAFGWLFLTNEERILWSAHEFGTARDAFLLMSALLQSRTWADRMVRHYYASSNYMAIVLTSLTRTGKPRVCEFTARTTSQGRGKSGPKAIWDEGLELRPEHLGAQDAVKSTYPWAQTLVGSSAAKSYSEVLHKTISDARAGRLGKKEWFREFRDDLEGDCELGAECTHVRGVPGCRLDDPARYKRANPALGRIHADGRGLTLEAIVRERAKQPDPRIFARERLGWHDELVVQDSAVFSEEAWTDLRDGRSKIVGERTLCLQVSPQRDWSAIVAGGRNDAGKIHLEVPSKAVGDGQRIYARWPGTDRVVPYLKRMLRKRELRLLIQSGSQAVALLPALDRLADDPKLHRLEIVMVPAESYAPACGFMQDQVAIGGVTHVGDPELQASMLAVGKRMIAERAFVWSPRSSSGDITAAVAATVLAWWLEQNPETDVEDSVG